MSLLFIIGVSTIQANSTQANLDNAFFADQMPTGAQVFAAIRTDAGYFDQLDGIFGKLSNGLSGIYSIIGLPISEMNLYQSLDMAVQSAGLEGDFQTSIRPWLGDKIGIGIYQGESSLIDTLVVIDIADRELAEAFVQSVAAGTLQSATEGDFTVYSNPDTPTLIAINDDVAYIATKRELIPFTGNPTESLATNADFQAAVGALSAGSYNIMLISDSQTLMQSSLNTTPMELAPFYGGYTAIGATIVDGVSATLDIAQLGVSDDILSYINVPLDPAFTQYIPTDATAVLHGTNLLPILNLIIAQASQNTGQDIQAQLNQLDKVLGFNVFNLLLSSDFAVYLTYNPDGIEALLNAPSVVDGGVLSTDDIDLNALTQAGFVFKISNPEDAQKLITQLSMLLGMVANSLPNATITTEQIDGRDVVVLTANTERGRLVDVIIGANDAVLVMGTRESATAILTGNGGFSTSATYQTALRYTLPTSTHYWFLDRNSVVAALDLAVLWLTPMSANSPESNQAMLETATEIHNQIETFAQLFNSATLTTSVKDNTLQIRAVITLSE